MEDLPGGVVARRAACRIGRSPTFIGMSKEDILRWEAVMDTLLGDPRQQFRELRSVALKYTSVHRPLFGRPTVQRQRIVELCEKLDEIVARAEAPDAGERCDAPSLRFVGQKLHEDELAEPVAAMETIGRFIPIPPEQNDGHPEALGRVLGNDLAPDLWAGNSLTVNLDEQPAEGDLGVFELVDGRVVVAWAGDPRLPAIRASTGAVCAIGLNPNAGRSPRAAW